MLARTRLGSPLPPRDRRYSLGLIGVFLLVSLGQAILAGRLAVSMPSVVLWGTGLGLVLNHLWWRVPFFPYDRIYSAVSRDGRSWIREDGVRLEVGGKHRSCQVYYPEVIAGPEGYRMYYRAGGYDSVIACAFSEDGLTWREDGRTCIGSGGRHGLAKVEGPEVVSLGNDGWRMYYAGHDGAFWRLYCARSRDGLQWEEEAVCVDLSQDGDAAHVKDASVLPMTATFRLYFVRVSSDESHMYTAESTDGLSWHSIRPCEGYGTDGWGVRTPCVSRDTDGRLWAYFAEHPGGTAIGSRIAGAVSEDGVRWTRMEDEAIAPRPEEGLHGVFCPDLVIGEDSWRMYFGGYWGNHWLMAHTLYCHRNREGRAHGRDSARRTRGLE